MFKTIFAHIFENWKDYFPGMDMPLELRPLFMRGDKWNMLYLFSDSQKTPLCVIEITSNNFDLLKHAADNMREINRNAHLRQFCPRVFYFGKLGGDFALIQEYCQGLPLLFLLQRKFCFAPARTRYVLIATEFLAKLHLSTKKGIALDGVSLSNYFNPLLEISKQNSAVSKILESIKGRHLYLVTSHKDYNPSNILVDREGNLKILDWEYATFDSLPLTDLFNFLLWAYRDIKKSDEVIQTFIKDTFLAKNSFSQIVKKAIGSYCKQINIDRDLALAIFLTWVSTKFEANICLDDCLDHVDVLFNYLGDFN